MKIRILANFILLLFNLILGIKYNLWLNWFAVGFIALGICVLIKLGLENGDIK